MLKDIAPGLFGSYPSDFVIMNDKVYFSAGNEEEGMELWVTDGTAAGTGLVYDIISGSEGSQASPIISTGNNLYFTAVVGPTGFELWKYNPFIVTSIPESNPLASINSVIYPNPSTGNLNINYRKSFSSVTVTNLQGIQEVFYDKNFHSSFKGLVIVTIHGEDGPVTQKVVLE